MKKKMLSLFLALALVVTLLPLAASAEEHTSHESWTELTVDTINGGSLADGSYYLSGNVTYNDGDAADGSVPITVTGTVTLCLNGHVLDLSGQSIKVSGESARLTLCDCTTSTTTTNGCIDGDGLWHQGEAGSSNDDTPCNLTGGVITDGGGCTEVLVGQKCGGAVVVSGGTFTMESGNIAGNSTVVGGGVAVVGANSQFTMKGGTITGNVAKSEGSEGNDTGAGGGVLVFQGSFTMKDGDGRIERNTAQYGGGIASALGSLTIESGTISGNTAGLGAGVYVENSAFELTNNGTIESNTADLCGGGVYVENSAFELTNNGTIESNTADLCGGGVYVENSTFTMFGGFIKNNQATGEYETTENDLSGGGGVYLNSGSFEMSSGTISGNSAVWGGGVFVGEGAFTLSGGTITGNSATTSGGGVFVGNDSTFKLSGGPTIKENTLTDSNNTPGNVYLENKIDNPPCITIEGALSYTDKIGVSMFSPGTFTSGWKDNMNESSPADYFISEQTGYEVAMEENEAVLKASTYSVTLNPNGGTITEGDVKSYTYGQGAKLPTEDGVTRAGYTFAGWYENDDFTGGPVTSISTTDTGNKDFWAKWTANTYTVKFNSNGGTGGTMGSQEFTYDVQQNLNENKFTRTGYTFAGWSTEQSGGVKYGDGVSVKNLAESGTVTLYAQWTANTYTVIFSANCGTGGTMENQVFTYDVQQKLSQNEFTRAGYTFAGWNISADGTGTHYTDEQEVGNLTAAAGGTVTLYAQWTVNSYKVILNANGGGIVPSENVTSYTYGQSTALPIPTKTGYTFAGWYDNATFNGDPVTVISKTDTGNKEFWAKWTAAGSGGGSSPTVSQQAISLINAAKEGDTVVIDLTSGDTLLKKEVFQALAGRNVTLVLHLDDEVEWTIYGKDISKTAALTDLDMAVTMNTSTIPVDVLNLVTGEKSTVQLTLAHDGKFGFTLTLTAPLGVKNEGLWANLYHYDKSLGKMLFQTAAQVDAGGKVALQFTHASEYAIVLDEKSHALPFTDVNTGDWFQAAVQYVYHQGVMTGTSATTFAPNTPLSRAMVAQILYNLEGKPAVTGESTFTDAGGHWAVDAIAWAKETGVVSGYENNTFRPDKAVTREELAQMLYNYAQYKKITLPNLGNLSKFPDGGKVSSWARNAMSWATGLGILNGYEDSTLRPGGGTTRAEAASMMMGLAAALAK